MKHRWQPVYVLFLLLMLLILAGGVYLFTQGLGTPAEPQRLFPLARGGWHG